MHRGSEFWHRLEVLVGSSLPRIEINLLPTPSYLIYSEWCWCTNIILSYNFSAADPPPMDRSAIERENDARGTHYLLHHYRVRVYCNHFHLITWDIQIRSLLVRGRIGRLVGWLGYWRKSKVWTDGEFAMAKFRRLLLCVCVCVKEREGGREY